ncbi:hypothetical protein GBA52_003505 [Prunus armeniaca]|nr:hypothetical protein GBA52_003505 [Prunus armeniaca]
MIVYNHDLSSSVVEEDEDFTASSLRERVAQKQRRGAKDDVAQPRAFIMPVIVGLTLEHREVRGPWSPP